MCQEGVALKIPTPRHFFLPLKSNTNRKPSPSHASCNSFNSSAVQPASLTSPRLPIPKRAFLQIETGRQGPCLPSKQVQKFATPSSPPTIPLSQRGTAKEKSRLSTQPQGSGRAQTSSLYWPQCRSCSNPKHYTLRLKPSRSSST